MKNSSSILGAFLFLVIAFACATWFLNDNSNQSSYLNGGKVNYTGLKNSKAGMSYNASAIANKYNNTSDENKSKIPTFKKKVVGTSNVSSVDFPAMANSNSEATLANNTVSENQNIKAAAAFISNRGNQSEEINSALIRNQTPQTIIINTNRQVVSKTDMDPAYLLYKLKPSKAGTAAQSTASKSDNGATSTSTKAKSKPKKVDGAGDPGNPGAGGSAPVGNGTWILLSLVALYTAKKRLF